ncbi:lycopene cyclase domain-containing protein [Allocatelliglobosispora scoriae]|uniref:Lycopene cyclase domain-containing protein n=1 Tax=Allocatelliglobosispora scoriae TaxID=643052 RepID=A0A841BPH2_9ACTN|nr:lycopene cyclase domain-containing protein [Allocatelliglobosispora scoriae]MBB5868731.1 lycopene cyclase domain-containing protein [Allocatelliglobosispora scoriae]
MSYAAFLCWFVAPTTLCGLIVVAGSPSRARLVIAGLIAVALAYTTPWDSWLIRNGVWGYPPDGVLGRFLLVPYEEYLFMVGMTITTGGWALWLVGRWRRTHGEAGSPALGAVAWLLVAGAAVVVHVVEPRMFYATAILAWFAPALAAQTAFGGRRLRAARRLRLLAVAVPTAWFWIADQVALSLGSWWISTRHTTGLHVAAVPIEEALFFLMVNVVVVNAVVLLATARPQPSEPEVNAESVTVHVA